MEREGAAARLSAPWLRAWLVVGLAAWTLLGVLLVNRANQLGLLQDISFSPYHLVGYAALLVLAVYVAWTFFRALRHGRWRAAFPPLYGGLGLAFVKEIAELHHGSATLDNCSGRGAIATLRLPIAAD